MTIMTNVLTSKRINRALLKEKGQQTLFAITKIFRKFHKKLLPDLFKLANSEETDPERKVCYQELEDLDNEVTLGTFLLSISIE